MDTTQMAMEIIVNAGTGKSLAFEALNAAKKGDFEKAEELLKESEEASLKAHHAQTKLITEEAKGEAMDVNLLLIHSQDHLMTSILARELIGEIIELHKLKKES